MKDSINNLVSIITPSYNSEKYISETIKSVINQSYSHWEMIIIDDLSTDNSVDIIENFLINDKRIILIKSDKNRGAGYCRNLGIQKASGQYHAFIDSDDIWYKKKLEVQISFMKKNNAAFSYMSYNFINEKGDELNIVPFKPKNKVNYNDMLKTNYIGCLTAMYDINKISTSKIFMSEIRARQDLSLWLRILKKIDYAHGINEVQASYRLRKKSISSNKLRAFYYQWMLYRNIEKFSFSKSIYFLIFYSYYGIIKYFKQKFTQH